MKLDITNDFDFSELDKLTKKLENLDQWEVEIGYYEEQSHPESELDLANLAWLMEVGSVKKNIPPRPFLFQTFTVLLSQPELESVTDILFMKKPLRSVLKEIGRNGEKLISDIIDLGDFVGNAPVTIENKGFDKPLVETGYLQNNAKSKVVKIK